MDAIDIEKYRAAFAALKAGRLNRRQQLVLLLGCWKTLKEAAHEMGVSYNTAETYKNQACEILSRHGWPMHGVYSLTRWAVEFASISG